METYIKENLGSLAREYYTMEVDGKSQPRLVDAERMLELDYEFAIFVKEAFYEASDSYERYSQNLQFSY